MTAPPAPDGGAAEGRDAAWVSVETPLAAAALADHVADVEGMLRVNPYLEFEEWRETGPDRYRFKARNLSNKRAIDTEVRVERTVGMTVLHYGSGLKSRTVFRIEPGARGAKLVITDDYGGTPPEERARRVDEVDRSLATWGGDLYRYFRAWQRWSWLAPWRWYMRRVWREMRPMARRIAYMLWMVTVFEIAAFALVFIVFVLELDKYVF
jgi:hypothetical protein